jgi:hypothetical protein
VSCLLPCVRLCMHTYDMSHDMHSRSVPWRAFCRMLGFALLQGEGTRQQQRIHAMTNFRNVMKVTWWLLTGHENGQLIMWDPLAPGLTPLIRIGEPTTSIRGIHVFEESCLVITAHQW